MIPTLLWRCPLCATNDALAHVTRRFRADRVHCSHCEAEWRLKRVPGRGFYMKLVKGDCDLGTNHSVAQWYDVMKRTVRLVPIDDPAMSTDPGEVLYLASGAAELRAEETDPLFFPERGDELSKTEKREIGGVMVGQGRLFLTSQRLLWQGNHQGGEQRSQTVSFPLSQINSAYAMMDYGVALLVGMRLYAAHFGEESVLKWVTYLALVGRQVEADTGHRITTSHF